ncbi:hypothetical protein ACFLRP_00260 [Bacteroidota bacterium]
MAIRWLKNSRQSMQRLGFLNAIVIYHNQARNAKQMSTLIYSELEKKTFKIAFKESYSNWPVPLSGYMTKENDIEISLQRYYIYNHPSHSGWLFDVGVHEYINYMPVQLGICNDKYELTQMGTALLTGLLTSQEIEAFKSISDVNPFIFEVPQQIYFLYNLLRADGDFLIPFYRLLIEQFGSKPFDYLQAGNVLYKASLEVLDNFRFSLNTRVDRAIWKDLENASKTVRDNIEKEKQKEGSSSRREHLTITRMEWLVDLGIAIHVDTRVWKFTEIGLQLKVIADTYKNMKGYPENRVTTLLDSQFYLHALKSYSGQTKQFQIIGVDEFLPFIRTSYNIIAPAGGYVQLRPLILLANIKSIGNSEKQFVDWEHAVEYLEYNFQKDSGLLHYTITRFNDDYQVTLF